MMSVCKTIRSAAKYWEDLMNFCKFWEWLEAMFNHVYIVAIQKYTA